MSRFIKRQENCIYKGGYKVSSAKGEGTGIPFLELRKSALAEESFSLMEETFPFSFSARVCLDGERVDFSDLSVCLVFEEKFLETYSLSHYQDLGVEQKELFQYGCYKNFKVIYEGSLLAEGLRGVSLLSPKYVLKAKKGQSLFEKVFNQQRQRHMVQTLSYIDGAWRTIPANGSEYQKKIFPVYVLGGYYKKGATKLNAIAQTYLTIDFEHETRTVPRFQSTFYWQKAGCSLEEGGAMENGDRVCFVDHPVPHQELSLGRQIDLGHVQVTLINQETNQEQKYISYGYAQDDLGTSFIEIHFKINKEG